MNTMLESSLHILLIEDNPNDERLIRRHLDRTDSALLPNDITLQHGESLTEATEMGATQTPNLLLLDLGLPESSGKETYERAREKWPVVPIIVLTGLRDEETAVELVQAGAQDYLNKDSLGEEMLVKSIRYALERQKQKRELKRKTRALDSAPVGVTITDPKQEDNPIVYFNDRFETITGYTAKEILGRNCRFLQGEETESEPVTEMREAIEEQQPVTVELRNYRKDGTEFWNRVSIAPVTDENGTLLNFIGFQQNITEEKERQEELQQTNEQLEVLNRIVRHDIQNDTQAIQLWAKNLEANISESEQESLQRIIENNEHIQELTESSKNLIETVTGEELETEPVRLDQIVQDELKSAQSRYPDADFIVEDSLSESVVSANETLSSGIRNLLNNAVQHNQDPVTVTVRVESSDDSVRLSVIDNGSGVPDEKKDEIFGKGERGLESEGTGIGLYLVNQLVQNFGGDVWVEDNEPEGSVFVVKLPTSESSQPTWMHDESH